MTKKGLLMIQGTFSLKSLYLVEILNSKSASGTYPGGTEFFKWSAGRNTSVGIAKGRVIYPSAGSAFIFFHSVQ